MPALGPRAVLAAWERGIDQDPVRRALALLTVADGRPDAASCEDAEIDVGSRDVLLARVLAGLAGSIVWTRAGCGRCGADLDVPVDLPALARLPVHPPGARFTTTVAGAEIIFRLPTSADLVSVRGLGARRARGMLLDRCVLTDDVGTDARIADAVEAAMDRVAPAGAAELLVVCPGCETRTPISLDLPTLLWDELASRAGDLLGDVHTLASAYGWTEAEVLALSPARRAAYLDLAAR
nr:hypothetical protein [Micromonospora sp. DSM 115978]